MNNEVVQPFQNANSVIDKYNLAIQHNSLTQQGWQRLLAQSDNSLKAYLTSIKGSTASMAGYNVSLQGSVTGFTKVSNAIKQYNALGTVSQKEQQAFATAVGVTNNKLGTYLIGLNGSTAGLRGYGVSLIASTAKTIGLTVATTALNAAMTMGISVIVTGLISAFTAWINKSEKITEKAQEASDKINSITESLKRNTETVENAKRRYAELAQEVENLGKITQSQGTLTNEEYEEFLNLSNQLAGIFPSLTKNYDDNGNAILNLSGDINTIVGSLDDLIQKEKELANQQIMEEFPDVFKGYAQDLSNAEQKIKSAQTEFDKINQAYNNLNKGQSIQMGFLPTGYNKEGTMSIGQYEGWLKDLGLTYEEINVEGGKVVTAVGDIDTAFTSKLETARENLQYAQQQLEGEKSSIDSYLNTWLQGEFSYNQIEDSGLQSAIQDILFNFNWDNLPDDIAKKFDKGNWVVVSEYLRRNILFSINNIDDAEVSKALSDIYTRSLTSGELLNAIEKVQTYFGDGHPISLSLEPKVGDVEPLMNSVKDKLKGTEFDNKVGELSLGNLKIASELEVPMDSIESWEELLTLIEEYKASLQDNTTDSTLFTKFTNSKDILDSFKSNVQSAYNAYSKLLNPNISPSDMLSSVQAINEAVASMGGKLNWEFIDKQANSLELLGDTIAYIAEKNAKQNLIDAGFSETLADSIIQAQRTTAEFNGMNNEIDRLQSSYQTLTDVLNSYNSTGHITLDNLQSLLTADENLISMLEVTNGKLVINEQAYKNLIMVQLLEFDTKLAKAAASEIEALALEKSKTALDNQASSAKNTVNSIKEHTRALDEDSAAAIANAEANALENGVSQEDIDAVKDKYDQIRNSVWETFHSGSMDDLFGGSPTKESAKESVKETANTFNFIETALSRVQRTITNLGKTVSATYKNWTTRNNALAQEMSKVNEELSLQQSAYNQYMDKANSVGLSDYYKNLVQNGGLQIESITDETLQDKIDEYTDWYEKALSCSDAVQDLRNNIADLAKTKFDNIAQEFDSQISLIEHKLSMIEESISQTEASGYFTSSKFYEALTNTQKDNIIYLKNEYKSLSDALQEALSSGAIETYSEEWYNMMSDINDVEKALQDANSALIDYSNTMRQIRWDLFDLGSEYVSGITDESDFLINLMDDNQLFDDDGKMNNYGQAITGLHAVNFNTYMRQADDYAKEIQRINADLAKDPYHTELINRRNELLELQRESILSADAEKQALKDIASEGYKLQLSYLQELIDKRKEALQREKDLYDYQRNIADKTNDIAEYKKLLESYANDDSEEIQAKVQQIKLKLEETEQALKDTEYDKWLSDQQQLIDDLYLEYETLLNQRLDDLSYILQEMIDQTNINADGIKTTISSTVSDLGYTLTNEMKTIWDVSGGIGQVVSDYVKNFSTISTGVQTSINAIKSLLEKMMTASDAKATEAIESNASTNVPSAPSTTSVNSTPSDSTTTVSQNDSNKSSDAWGSWFIHKNDYYDKDKLNSGTSVVDGLKKQNFDSSYSARASYYAAMGGTGTYTGSASQNTWMLEEMKKHGFAKGGTIGELVKKTGEDGFVLARTGEEILSLEKLDALKGVFEAIPQPQFLNYAANIPQHIAKPNVVNNFDNMTLQFDLPNVKDVNDFVTELQHNGRFEKIVQQMTFGNALGQNSLTKNRF